MSTPPPPTPPPSMPPPPPGFVPPPSAASMPSAAASVAALTATKSGVPKVAIVVAAVVLGALAVTVLSNRGSKSAVTTTVTATTVASANGSPASTNALAAKPGETQPVVITGATLADLPEKGDDPAIGQPAPVISGRDFQGAPVVVTPGDGKPKLMLFVAHWCPHCQREVPLVVKWLKDGSIPPSIDVVAISTSFKSAQGNPPSKWLAKEGWSNTIVVDDEKSTAALAYGLTGFPFFTLVDAEGNVVARASGELGLPDLQALLAKVS